MAAIQLRGQFFGHDDPPRVLEEVVGDGEFRRGEGNCLIAPPHDSILSIQDRRARARRFLRRVPRVSTPETFQDRQELPLGPRESQEEVGAAFQRFPPCLRFVRFRQHQDGDPPGKPAESGHGIVHGRLGRPPEQHDGKRQPMGERYRFFGIVRYLAVDSHASKEGGEAAKERFLAKAGDKDKEAPSRFPSLFPREVLRHSTLGVGRSGLRRHRCSRTGRARLALGAARRLLAGLLLLAGPAAAPAFPLSPAQAEWIGRRLWQNESGGTLSGLTAWNPGENFASLGIGHFIWYPAGVRGPFEESFPQLLRFLESRGVSVPGWLREARFCPWPDRRAFFVEFESGRMRELRSFLADTVAEQTRFAIDRLSGSLPKMLACAPEGERQRIETNFRALEATPGGLFALVDYVNFKGDGTFPTERYQNAGWGLLDVLRAMEPGPALPSFRRAARLVLERRVRNAPSARHEERWLRGWLNRVDGYREGSAG